MNQYAKCAGAGYQRNKMSILKLLKEDLQAAKTQDPAATKKVSSPTKRPSRMVMPCSASTPVSAAMVLARGLAEPVWVVSLV